MEDQDKKTEKDDQDDGVSKSEEIKAEEVAIDGICGVY